MGGFLRKLLILVMAWLAGLLLNVFFFALVSIAFLLLLLDLST